MYDIENLKIHTFCRWQEIILSLAPHLSPMIERGRRHGPCPLCGGKDRARCHNDFEETGGVFCNQCSGGANGFAVLQWANGWTFLETVDAVCKHLGLADSDIPKIRPIQKLKPQQEKDWSVERQRLQTIWDGSTPDTGRIARYFKSRGITVPVPPTLRLHPSHFYFHQGSEARYPTMLAQIVMGGKAIGLHQTWLAPDGPGKADVSKPKKSRKCAESMRGGAIRLYPAESGKPIGLVEGIETAISVHQLTGLPTWSCINSGMLERVILPDSVREIYIGADKDRSGCGQRAADRLAKRLVGEGREVQIVLPPGEIPDGEKSVDWSDVLMLEVAV